MTGYYRLGDNLRFCEIGGERVFLDLAGDRYFRLPPAADRILSETCWKGATDGVEPLVKAGILVEAPRGRPLRPTSHPFPKRSLLEERPDSAISFSCLPEVLILVLQARMAVGRSSLPRLLEPPTAAGEQGFRASSRLRDRGVLTFLRARRLVPVAANCLHDTLALRRFLRRRKIGADLVIGTRLNPFGAHCWLQDGTVVLNDSLANAQAFTPILVA